LLSYPDTDKKPIKEKKRVKNLKPFMTGHFCVELFLC
jgi:3-hydroxymyristoyl/3-hydroxydecanoyl-(acyl carrier protein) dehydratase